MGLERMLMSMKMMEKVCQMMKKVRNRKLAEKKQIESMEKAKRCTVTMMERIRNKKTR